MEIKSHKILYYSDDNFQFEVEQGDGVFLIHSSVFKFSPSILRTMYSVVNSLTKELREFGADEAFTISPNPRFAKLFGGETVNTLYYENKEYEVIRWDLRLQQ